jgi:GDP-mannose 6-dehydrogenase
MIKYACNCFHAVKVAFANEMSAVSEALGASGSAVMRTLCQDTRLNISPAYLKPGFAFGGSCLLKDLRALTYKAVTFDVDAPLLGSTIRSNDAHLKRTVNRILKLPAQRLGVFGLAFKENTDDLRESQAVTLLEFLIGKGKDVKVFDPHIRMDNIYGSNRNYILNAIPHIGRLLVPSIEALIEWCDHLVLTQSAEPSIVATIRDSGVRILDVAQSEAEL